ncbi:PIG-L family deacetylase [Martelella endophytica]|uniref:LmbE family protein n=1 Tax=Martelella endophytica TaxID=1486262 RepID=A0A0D5LSE9_MAREN|nr:PIG-L family deacetylase [Martelella endophytica]AJY47134.1 LmbE family protein [Martelella endophytica]
MLTPRQRIEQEMSSSAHVRLYRALTRLTSPVTMMNTGAHPDDEQSGLLAWLSLGLGMRVIIACSTRGEGGQNVLGPERLGALGVLRTRELEEAARALDADIHWLGHGSEDPVHDFGFSKDGDATFARWGEDRIVERMVRAYRAERPDIVLPTFLDVPGQHGHHRAMTRAAETAIRLAADETAYPEHFAEGLKPWKVAKYYLPAWSGGGGTYDDDLPPPPATLTIDVDGKDPVTGADFDRIGEWSRYCHASQGMGHWPERPDHRWQLHLLLGESGSVPEAAILDGLPTSLAALAESGRLHDTLAAADAAIAAAITAFPNARTVQKCLAEALSQIEAAEGLVDEAFDARHSHRLARKRAEIAAALIESAGLFERAFGDADYLSPGGSATLSTVLAEGASAEVTPNLPAGVQVAESRDKDGIRTFTLAAAADAPLSNQYPPLWSSLGGNGPVSVTLKATIAGCQVAKAFDLETPLPLAPAHSVALKPNAFIVPLQQLPMKLSFSADTDLPLHFNAEDGFGIVPDGGEFTVQVPQAETPGLTVLTPEIDGKPAANIASFTYPHIGKNRFIRPETLSILTLDLKLPDGAKVGYVSGGADNVGTWLSRMGLDVTELDANALSGDLSRFTTIVIGIFAFGTRPDLAAATMKLHRFVEDGGHLVTLYHRPSDGWSPETTPPRYLKIGTPSLRWRVTNPAADVDVLLPDHKLLKGPNPIGPDDWAGWHKERGLYFSAEWDDAYEPLLAMHDEGEKPLHGALVSAPIGKGRHTHTSLVLHYQMDRLTPGAFRLMANLVQPA